ncbi:hypothetical protein LTR09_007716 [Extremus antarcticus]|uniref:Uncharacterized protein n=1 Tax=Extremus antarcticus TaxID=702011 RepID=A0AAJ0DC24_9PEZI|nr:hypothetical protein LTR09_007716 [Extremus antarcticus]
MATDQNLENADIDRLGDKLSNLQVAPTSTPFTCFCNERFDSKHLLSEHATVQGHRFRCGCGELRGTRKQLTAHQNEVVHEANFGQANLEVLSSMPSGERAFLALLPHPPPEDSLRCEFCPKKIIMAGFTLQDHTRTMHPCCPVCSEQFHDDEKNADDPRSTQQHLVVYQTD